MPPILLIGNTNRPEFRTVTDALLPQFGGETGSESVHFSSLPQFLTNVSSDSFYGLAVLLESRPGEYPTHLTAKLRTLFPVMPIVLLAGSLCEGEGRTGILPSGVIRYYWYEWETACLPELRRFFRHQTSRFSLPQTANDEDYARLIPPDDTLPQTLPFTLSGESICCVVSPDSEMRELLGEREECRFGQVLRFRSLEELSNYSFGREPVSRIIFDSFDTGSVVSLLGDAPQKFSNSDWTILLFAPKPEDLEQLRAVIPKLTVLPKPFACWYE